MSKTWIWALSVLLLLGAPLGVGYLTAPCDTFGEPVILSPYRLRQQHFLQQATRWLQESQEVEAALLALTQAEQPQSMGEAFQLAEQAALSVCGHRDGVTVRSDGVAYRLYKRSARKIQLEQ